MPTKEPIPVMSDDLRNAISRLKGERPGADLTTPATLAQMFPVSAEIAGETEIADTENPEIGQLIPGKGIFIGTKDWCDRKGSLGTFNFFAAPVDLLQKIKLKLAMTFDDAVAETAKTGNLLGHKGGDYANGEALYKAVKSGQYKGEWFIPPHDILLEDLYKNKDKGALMGTFAAVADRYWSCTERRDSSAVAWSIRFSGGDAGGDLDKCVWVDKTHLSAVRLVRAEPRALYRIDT